MELSEQRMIARNADVLGKIYRYVRSLDSFTREQDRKLNVLLILSCGNLLITVLVLIALAFK